MHSSSDNEGARGLLTQTVSSYITTNRLRIRLETEENKLKKRLYFLLDEANLDEVETSEGKVGIQKVHTTSYDYETLKTAIPEHLLNAAVKVVVDSKIIEEYVKKGMVEPAQVAHARRVDVARRLVVKESKELR